MRGTVPESPTESIEGASASRQQVIDDLLATMAWDPKERVGAFRTWLRGSLSLVHLQVITTLEAEGPLSMTRLADALDVSVASTTGIVGRMEERGLVERRHRSDDRRVVEVHVTRRGERVFQVMERARRDRFRKVLEQLTDSQLDAFLVGMQAMAAARARLRSKSEGADR